MKSTILIAMGILLIFGQAGATESLDLDEYLSLVVDYSRDLKLADRERAMAGARKSEATAGALPKIFVEAGYVRNFTDNYMFVDPGAFNGGDDGDGNGDGNGGGSDELKFKINRYNEFTATAVLDQVIFSPAVRYGIRGAGQYQELADFMYEASYQAIITQAKRVFYQAVLFEKVWEVRVAAEENARENYDSVKAKFESGLVSEFALLQAEVRWKNTIPDTSQARRDRELVLNNLKTMAGISVLETVDLNLSLDEYPALPDTVDVEAVLARRPDYNTLVMEEKLRETSVKANRAAYYPTLYGRLAGIYTAQSDEWRLDQENTIWQGSLRLSIPIFMGGATRARVKQASIDLEKTHLRIDRARDDIYKELANIFLWMQEARERIESAEATLVSAERAFRIAEATSRNGLATQLELKDARLDLDEARLNHYLAIYDYMVAHFEWDRATGEVEFEKPTEAD
jgi:outer membrane protein TolC